MKLKRLLALLILSAALLTLASCGGNGDTADGDSEGDETTPEICVEEYYIGKEAVNPKQLGAARLGGSDGVTLDFVFGVPVSIYSQLQERFDEVAVRGYAGEYAVCGSDPEKGGYAVAPEYLGEREVDGVATGIYLISLNAQGAETVLTEYCVQLRLVFEGEQHYSVPSLGEGNVASLYSAAASDLLDRSPVQDDDHPYLTDEGDYSRVDDPTVHMQILYGALDLSLRGDVLTDKLADYGLDPLYEVSWFDGILTVGAKNGEINPNILTVIRLNGRTLDYEVRNGIIRVVCNEVAE